MVVVAPPAATAAARVPAAAIDLDQAGVEATWDGRIAAGLPGVRRRTMRPRHLAVVISVAATVALLLNAVPMERAAETSPFGVRRTVSLAILHPIAALSDKLGLDRPRSALDALAGHGDPGAPGGTSHDVSDGSPVTAGTLAPVSPTLSVARRAPAASREVALRVPTPADPLRLWVGGDSVAGYFGFGMDDLAAAARSVSAHSHYQVSTGLSRPDYYDWPAHLEQDMTTYDPEVVVFLVGANDDQPLEVGGQVADFGSDAWKAEYGRRVGSVMDRLLAEGRMVVWVGQPVMRSADFDNRMQVMNAIYRQEVARRPGVTYFDSRPVLADGGGGYSAYLPDTDGTQTLMRAPDGIHLTPAGGRRLAHAVLATVLATVASRGEAGASFGSR